MLEKLGKENILFLKENSTKDCSTTNSLSNDGITTCSCFTKTLYDNKIQYQIKSWIIF